MYSAVASRQTPLARARSAPSVARMLGNETSKGLILLWDNRRTFLPELGALLVFYFLIQFLVGGGRVVPALFAPTLLAFGFYTLLYIVTLKLLADLMPTTLGVQVTRKLLLQGGSLASAWSDQTLVWLLLHSFALLILGAVAYELTIRRALREGRLGPR